jgi:hypothetical protein
VVRCAAEDCGGLVGRPGLTGPVPFYTRSTTLYVVVQVVASREWQLATHSSSMRVKGLIAGCPVDEWAHLALLIHLPEVDMNLSS